MFDGDIAFLHQTGVIAKSQDSSLDGWARDYFLASEADRCLATTLCFVHKCYAVCWYIAKVVPETYFTDVGAEVPSWHNFFFRMQLRALLTATAAGMCLAVALP